MALDHGQLILGRGAEGAGAGTFGPVEAIEPVYVRAPDAERWRG